jgi:acyl dehydratase
VTLDPTLVGHRTEPHRVRYQDRDVLLYNLAVGAEAGRDLPLLYEGFGPKVVPSFAVILAWPAVAALFDVVMGGDLSGIVHGAQAIRVHRPIPPSAEVVTTGRIEGVYDLKRLAVSILSTETRTQGGELLAETEWEIVHLTEGGFGGEKPPKKSRPQKPSEPPLFEAEVKTHAEQALLYRLTGDRNPLHADPEFAKKVGFDRPILHGLCTFGIVARVLTRELAGNDPARLRALRGQFVKPVFPGETLVVRAHRLEEGVRVEAEVRERSEIVFGFGLAELDA